MITQCTSTVWKANILYSLLLQPGSQRHFKVNSKREKQDEGSRLNTVLQECTPQPCKVQQKWFEAHPLVRTCCKQPNFILFSFSFCNHQLSAYSIQHCHRCGFHLYVAVLSVFILKHRSLITISTSLLHIVHVVLMFCLFECHAFVKKMGKG